MIVSYVAQRAGQTVGEVRFTDVGFDAGLLGAKAGSLDIVAVGLTQLTEAKKDNAKVVLDMNTLGFADITGFVVRKRVLETKRGHVENVIRMWFDCVSYVMRDIDSNSRHSLTYLSQHAATKYTIESYKVALSQEFFPISIAQMVNDIELEDGIYAAKRIHEVIASFLVSQKAIPTDPGLPKFIELR